jgi:hypothetical protein
MPTYDRPLWSAELDSGGEHQGGAICHRCHKFTHTPHYGTTSPLFQCEHYCPGCVKDYGIHFIEYEDLYLKNSFGEGLA